MEGLFFEKREPFFILSAGRLPIGSSKNGGKNSRKTFPVLRLSPAGDTIGILLHRIREVLRLPRHRNVEARQDAGPDLAVSRVGHEYASYEAY